MIQDYDNIKKTDTHIVSMWEPFNKKIDKNYKFINNSFIFKIFSYITAIIAFIILYPFITLSLGVKTKGRKYLQAIKSGGIVVANHTHLLDCVLLTTHGIAPKFPYVVTRKGNFNIPFIRHFIRLGRAVPIPEDMSAKRQFSSCIYSILTRDILLVFPEGSMWPYYDKLRPFKKGAFKFAVKAGVPIVPACITHRPPNKFYKLLGRKKPLVNIEFFPAVYPNKDENELQKKVYLQMKTIIEQK